MTKRRPGPQILTADEAVEAIALGDHAEAGDGGIEMDVALIDLIRAGEVIAARFPDGRIAFMRIGDL